MPDFVKNNISKVIKVFLDYPIGEDTINSLLGMREWVPGLKKAKVQCDNDLIGIDVEYLPKDAPIKLHAAARLLGLKATREEKVARLVPQGAIQISTECHEIQISFKDSPALVKEWMVFASFLPDVLKTAIEVEKDCIAFHVHRLAPLNEEINKRASKEIMGRKISVFDYVTIQDVKIQPGAIRIIAG